MCEHILSDLMNRVWAQQRAQPQVGVVPAARHALHLPLHLLVTSACQGTCSTMGGGGGRRGGWGRGDTKEQHHA